MADLLGVQEYLTPKLEATFAKGQLGKVKNPKGLASKWLAEGTRKCSPPPSCEVKKFI